MKLVVLLKTASKPCSRQSMSVNSSRLKTGRPSMTVLSKRMRRPRLCGLGRDALPVPGDRPLVGGDDVHAEVEGGLDVAGRDRGVVLLHDGELDEHVGAGGGEQLVGRPRRLGQRRPLGRRCQHRGRRHSFARRAGCRAASPAPVTTTRRPCSSASARSCCASSAQKAARHVAEAEQAELDGARLGVHGQRTEVASPRTASRSRSSSSRVVYGHRPTRTRPPRSMRPRRSTRRTA